MGHAIPIDPSCRADDRQRDWDRNDGVRELVRNLAFKRLAVVNVVFFGQHGSGDREWVLIDTGMPGTAGLIVRSAERRFGPYSRPAAIILTHGHFDHAGSAQYLADMWNAPIFAHEEEMPFLLGSDSYPPPDRRVGGGVLSALSELIPRGPIDLSEQLSALPSNGRVPGMPDWQWIHTPGHTPGHVVLWREMDRTLIAGDAVITTSPESAYAVATQRTELHGPPMYFTPDWNNARISVEKLAALEPTLVVPGHGWALRGEEVRNAMHTLARDFGRIAVPLRGRYVTAEARTNRSAAK
jgi:glyoxylase-like metal-dependent hydrolase (beta-lactamase superfamily II)